MYLSFFNGFVLRKGHNWFFVGCHFSMIGQVVEVVAKRHQVRGFPLHLSRTVECVITIVYCCATVFIHWDVFWRSAGGREGGRREGGRREGGRREGGRKEGGRKGGMKEGREGGREGEILIYS